MFGSAAYKSIPQERRNINRANKFAPVLEKLVFVGYDSLDSDIYLLMNTRTGAVTREKNVVVADGVFPFAGTKKDCQCQSDCTTTHSERPLQQEELTSLPFYLSFVHSSGGDEAENGRVDNGQTEEAASPFTLSPESTNECDQPAENAMSAAPISPLPSTTSLQMAPYVPLSTPNLAATPTTATPSTAPSSLTVVPSTLLSSPAVVITTPENVSTSSPVALTPPQSSSSDPTAAASSTLDTLSPILAVMPPLPTKSTESEDDNDDVFSDLPPPPKQHKMVLRDRSTLQRPLRF